MNPGVRSLMRCLVEDRGEEVRSGEEAFGLFGGMLEDAERAGLRVEDIEHMRDLMGILVLVRRYYFGGEKGDSDERIAEAKRAYKARWPKTRRYRIRRSAEGPGVAPVIVGAVLRLLFRSRAAYGVWDRLFVLPVPGVLYRSLHRCHRDSLPKFLRKSAMGVDVVLR